MNSNPYIVFMLSDSATQIEVDEAYNRLKKQYANDRFLEGSAGNIAAKKLQELEVAYKEVCADLQNKKITEDFGSVYGEIESLIKGGELDSAQNKLDEIVERSAEWHYLQSVLFYRKSWQLESKKQLEIAIKLDPQNAKYIEALVKLENAINNKNGVPTGTVQHPSGAQQSQGEMPPPTQPQMAHVGSCCLNLWCADSCCECMGGDLISCC